MSLSDLRPGDTARLFGNPKYDEVVAVVRSSIETEDMGTIVYDVDGNPYPEEYGWDAEIMSFADPVPSAMYVTWVGSDSLRHVACRATDLRRVESREPDLWLLSPIWVPEEFLRKHIGDSRVTELIPDTGSSVSLNEHRPGDTVRFFGNTALDEAIVVVNSVSVDGTGTIVLGSDGRSYPEAGWQSELVRFADPLPTALTVTWVDRRFRVRVAHRERVTDGLWTMDWVPVPEEDLRRNIGGARVTALIPVAEPEQP